MTTIQERLAQIETSMSRYYDRDVVAELKARVEGAQEEFKAWQARRGSELDAQRKTVDTRFSEYEAVRSQVDLSEQSLAAAKARLPVAEYNLLVEKHNQLVGRCSQLGGEFEQAQSRHNADVGDFNTEQEARMHALEDLRSSANKEILEYRRWLEGDGRARLWVEINELFALVRNQPDRAAGDDSEKASQRLRAIRRTLGERAVAEQRSRSSGLLIVRCKLSGSVDEQTAREGSAAESEEAFLVVDSGATTSAITPEMVKILQLERLQGEEVDLLLPNRIRVRAPQILLPAVETHECKARFIEGVVLHESTPGIDGTLGLSFLNKFDYTLTKDTGTETGGTVPSLALKAPELPSNLDPGTFDVFICHKKEDLDHASAVYEELRKHGRRPFLAAASLEGHADFTQKIDSVLEAVDHLVVVASSRMNAEAPWVRREWLIFELLCLRGEKQGSNIVTVMCGRMNEGQLPPGLMRFQAISKGEANWPTRLVAFLPKPLPGRRIHASDAQ
jgi:TIR domain/gag-polyprotein putative aspartyl protease